MARPPLKIVHYFPFIVKDGRTLFLLENKYGCKGTGFFTNMLRVLSETPDHHLSIKDEVERMVFFGRTKVDENSGMDMIKTMVKTSKIDQKLWEEKNVICCPEFLESIKDAYSKRNNPIITVKEIYHFYGIEFDNRKYYSPVDTEFPEDNSLFEDTKNQHNNIKGVKKTQSKEKEIKKDESKKKEKDEHLVIPVEFHKRLNEKLNLSTSSTESENQYALNIINQINDIPLIIKCLDSFFDDRVDWFFTRKSKEEPDKRIYRFKTFCSNITDLVSYIRKIEQIEQKNAEEEKIKKVKSSPPRKCPKCGKTMRANLNIVGCKKCKIIYEYKNELNKWEFVA